MKIIVELSKKMREWRLIEGQKPRLVVVNGEAAQMEFELNFKFEFNF